MKKIATIIISMFSFATFAQEWTLEDKAAFMQECVQLRHESVSEVNQYLQCECALNTIIQLYPTTDEVNALTQEEITAITYDCASAVNLQLETMDNSNPDTWNETEKHNYTIHCKLGLVGAVIDPNEFCSCSLEKIMGKFPKPSKLPKTTKFYEKAAKQCIEMY